MGVRVKAIGSIGNQPLGYLAGLYAPHELEFSLVLGLHRQRQNHHQGPSISYFNVKAYLGWPDGLNELAVSFLGISTLNFLASGIVISKSTFSYWAVMLGQLLKVICPTKWFRFGEDPEDLSPPSWYRTEGLWI